MSPTYVANFSHPVEFCEGKYGGLFRGGPFELGAYYPEYGSCISAAFIAWCGLHTLLFWQQAQPCVRLISSMIFVNGIGSMGFHATGWPSWGYVDGYSMFFIVWLACSYLTEVLMHHKIRTHSGLYKAVASLKSHEAGMANFVKHELSHAEHQLHNALHLEELSAKHHEHKEALHKARKKHDEHKAKHDEHKRAVQKARDSGHLHARIASCVAWSVCSIVCWTVVGFSINFKTQEETLASYFSIMFAIPVLAIIAVIRWVLLDDEALHAQFIDYDDLGESTPQSCCSIRITNDGHKKPTVQAFFKRRFTAGAIAMLLAAVVWVATESACDSSVVMKLLPGHVLWHLGAPWGLVQVLLYVSILEHEDPHSGLIDVHMKLFPEDRRHSSRWALLYFGLMPGIKVSAVHREEEVELVSHDVQRVDPLQHSKSNPSLCV